MKKLLFITGIILLTVLFTNLTATNEAASYSFKTNEANLNDLYARNDAHEFRADFDEKGVKISNYKNDWKFDWQLKSIGRGENQIQLKSSETIKKGNRIEIEKSKIQNPKSKILTEWFENQPDGLEQGFVVYEKQMGDEKLRLILTTDSIAKATDDGQTLELSNKENGKIMRYENLKVWDAENTILNAEMRVDKSGEIFLEVEDAAAVYPVTIDPKFVQIQKINETSRSRGFGESFAVSGDRMIIGSPDADIGGGLADLYDRINGVWTHNQRNFAIVTDNGDHYGAAVAISGNTIAVAAPDKNSGRGNVTIFKFNGTTWNVTQTLIAPDAVDNQHFGRSLALQGDTLIVGATGGTNTEGAYVFRDVGGFVFRKKIVPSDSADLDGFAGRLSYSGNTVVIRGGQGTSQPAPDEPNGGGGRKIYVFTGSDANWTEQAKISSPSPGNESQFGNSFDLDSNTLVVGSVSGSSSSGKAHVYQRNGTFWIFQTTLAPGNEVATQEFGYDVSINGNTITVSDLLNNGEKGAVFLFNGSGNIWSQRQKLTAADTVNGQRVGLKVELQNKTVFVTPLSSDTLNRRPIYVFQLNLSVSADFDGDRKTDVSVFRPSNGAWYLQQSTAGFGAVTFGASTDLPAPADFDGDGKTDVSVFRPSNGTWYGIFSSTNTFQAIQFGQNGDLPRPGDFDGDGVDDVCVFRPSTGGWYRYNSSNGAFVGVTFGQNGDRPLIADFDGDGRTDITVFRPSTGSFYSLDSSTGAFRGAAFGIGTDVPTLGDFDGDGKTDVAVFRPSNGGWYRLNSSTGAFYGTIFGQSDDIPAVGDFDGDGKSDISVFRTSNGAWYRLNSSNGNFVGLIFGFGTDKPIPSVFN